MRPFQYQLLRYMHDKLTGEFVNVGVVVYSYEEKFFQAEVISRYSRISQFFGEFDGHYILRTLKNIKRQINLKSKSWDNISADTSIFQLTSKILPKDDSSLYFTDISTCLDLNPEALLSDLFNNYVDRYNKDKKDTGQTDEKVWRGIYKRYFDEYNLAEHLRDHTVVTEADEIKFDKAWKNGAWHCYQAVSFDLKTTDAIKDKAYKWVGKINQILSSEEELHLYLLTAQPQQHKELTEFIDSILKFESNSRVSVRIVKENEAGKFALEVKEQMQHSLN